MVFVSLSFISDFIFPSSCLCSVPGVYHSHGSGWLILSLFKILPGVPGVQLHHHLQHVQGGQGGERECDNFATCKIL
jgi:hypothetical protein